MLARYRKSGVKQFRYGNVTVQIDSEKWTPIHDVRVFMKIKEHVKVFDVVQFFDYRPLIPIAKKIRVEKNLIKTSDKLAAEKMKQIQFLKLQAVKPEKGEYIFRIVNYDNRDFRVFNKVGKILNVFMHRGKGGIGDVIMTTPVIEAAKVKYPASKITYSTLVQFLPLLEQNPFIDELVPLKAKETQKDFDIVVDLTTDCIKYELSKKMAVDLNRPEIFAKSCGLTFDNVPAPKVFLSRCEILRARDELARMEGLKIGLVLTSCAPVRRWHGFVKLRGALQTIYPTANILEISEVKPDGWVEGDRVYPVFDRTLREVTGLLNECDVVVSPDTGPAHIASSLRRPVVWVFTHIDGKVRTKGYEDAVVVQNVPKDCPSKGVPCWYEIPCSKVGNVSVLELRENPPCSKAITVDMVFEEVVEILSKPDISYVIVYHDQDKIVRECVRRVLKYKRNNDEVVLIDNGSERGPEVVFKDLFNQFHGNWPITFHRNEENLGCIKARNQGLKLATGKYVVFLDSDQYISSETIHGLFVTEGDLVGVEGWSMDNAGLCDPIEEEKGRLAYVGAGGLLVKRSILEELDGFCEEYSPAWFEDPDICFRARQKGYTIGCNDNTGIIHLEHRTVNNQKTFSWKEAWDNSHRIFLQKWKKWLAIRFIRLVVDVPGWAWDNKAQQVKKYLENDYDIDIEYQSGEQKPRWGDALYFTFECNENMMHRIDKKRPYITGVTAHTYVNMKSHEAILEDALAVHANSMLLFEEVKKFNKNCYYLPNGVDEDLFRYSRRDTDHEFTVGYVGKAHERKGLGQFIIPACDRAGVRLITQACKYNDSNKINHLLMPGFYHNVDVVLIASDMDGTPNQLLEAASVGRTFIGNGIGNVPEFVDEGVNGFMVEREVGAYVEKLEWLRDHRETCRVMGVEARRTVEKGWTWKAQAEKYREMFQRCIS